MLTLSRQEGIGGEVKSEPEDFIVREITSKGITLEQGRKYTSMELKEEELPEGKFTTFVLEKRNWDTIRALLTIAKRLGRGRKSIGYAGTKDKQSISVQLGCIYGIDPNSLQSVSIRDIKINGAWKSGELLLGSNLGNSFTTKVKNIHNPEKVDAIIEDLGGLFPNYFDRQRFGFRLNNAKIGLAILNNNFEDAVITFLTDTSNETDPESNEARRRLNEERDFKGALSYFPMHLRYERTLIDYLSRQENFANALRNMPRGLTIMFIHAVEALIFNASLEERINQKDFATGFYCKQNFYGFPDVDAITESKDAFALVPIIGYETEEKQIGDYEKGLMEKLGISKDSFKIKSLPELSMRGSFRPILSPFKDFSKEIHEDQASLGFALPSGSYATIFLREITKSEGLELKSLMP